MLFLSSRSISLPLPLAIPLYCPSPLCFLSYSSQHLSLSFPLLSRSITHCSSPYFTPSISFLLLYVICSFGDATPLSTTSTLEHIAPSACRPRPLVRQQSLQQPLTPRPPPPPNDPPATSQSLGQLHSSSEGGGGQRGGARPGARGSPAAPGASRYRAGAGARSRSNPGSWDHMMGQIRTRGMDVKSFL